MGDLIDRQAAIDALNGLVNRFEQLLRDIRESKVDDSVCGLCEYDGAYIGQSGDWFNECPGFDKDDCFKLSDDCRKRWLKEANLPSAQPIQTASNYLQSLPTSPLLVGKMPSAQSEPQWIPCSERLPDKTDDYLCSYDGCAVVDICEYDTKRKEWGFFYDGGWKVVSNVIAWMPLPDPYKERREG